MRTVCPSCRSLLCQPAQFWKTWIRLWQDEKRKVGMARIWRTTLSTIPSFPTVYLNVRSCADNHALKSVLHPNLTRNSLFKKSAVKPRTQGILELQDLENNWKSHFKNYLSSCMFTQSKETQDDNLNLQSHDGYQWASPSEHRRTSLQGKNAED